MSINPNVMLSQQFLPAMRQISSEFFIFQQDSAPDVWRNGNALVLINLRRARLVLG